MVRILVSLVQSISPIYTWSVFAYVGYCHNTGRGRSDGKTLHCLRFQGLWEADALYTCYNTVDCEGIGVESARMAMFSGNEYVGVDSD